ncbi:MAG: M20/M25/M40 family metallo-hydrolase [Ignavibacteriales bacterium]|nr:MAG: M20/M25/M40 family metallo-hydrolase [Ignavibacteriales bacterium]
MEITMTDRRLLEIFFELIKIDATSGKEKPVADYIIAFLNNLGLNATVENIDPDSTGQSGNVICSVGNGGSFVLLSHMDTARSTSEVKPTITDDRILSDGKTVLGVDNRAGISSILCAVEKAIKQKTMLNDFTIAFTTQEETTMYGSRNLKLSDKIKMGFVFDSHERPGNFVNGSIGAVGFTARIIGKASHSGLAPEKGIDSIKIASGAIAEIKLGRIDDETTANIGIIKGGSAVNVVPEETFIEGEVRSMKTEKVIELAEQIKKIFEKHTSNAGGKLEFNYQWDFKPYKVTPEDEVFKKISSVISKVGLIPTPKISRGGSDANSLNEKGIKTVNLGIGAENPHSNEEYILLEDLQKSSEIAYELIKK